MRRVALIAMVVFSVLIFTSAENPTHVAAQEQPQNQSVQSDEQQPEKAKKKVKVVEVKKGDSLSKIAKRTNSTYKRIYYFNKKVKDPNVIYPGWKLKIPSKNQKLKKRPMGVVAAKPAPQTSSVRTYAAPRPEPVVSTAGDSASGGVWDRLAACESGGNWHINTGNGYYGGLQFSLSSWRGVGGSGYPHQASKSEQIKRATMLKNSGGWGHWPACSAKLGLR